MSAECGTSRHPEGVGTQIIERIRELWNPGRWIGIKSIERGRNWIKNKINKTKGRQTRI